MCQTLGFIVILLHVEMKLLLNLHNKALKVVLNDYSFLKKLATKLHESCIACNASSKPFLVLALCKVLELDCFLFYGSPVQWN